MSRQLCWYTKKYTSGLPKCVPLHCRNKCVLPSSLPLAGYKQRRKRERFGAAQPMRKVVMHVVAFPPYLFYGNPIPP